jgi:ketosteroid isomerase-like protein
MTGSTTFVLDEAFVQQFYTAFLGARDLAEFAEEHFASDVVWDNFLPEIIPFGGSWEGRAAVVEFLTLMMGQIRIKAFDIERILVAGNSAVITGHEDSDVTTNGNAYGMDWVHILDFDDTGRVARAREYNDTAAMQAAFAGTES